MVHQFYSPIVSAKSNELHTKNKGITKTRNGMERNGTSVPFHVTKTQNVHGCTRVRIRMRVG